MVWLKTASSLENMYFLFTNFKIKEILLNAKNGTEYVKTFYFDLCYKIVKFVPCYFYFYHWYVVKNCERFLHQLHSFNQSIKLLCSDKKIVKKNIFLLKIVSTGAFSFFRTSFAIKDYMWFYFLTQRNNILCLGSRLEKFVCLGIIFRTAEPRLEKHCALALLNLRLCLENLCLYFFFISRF